MPVVEIHLVEGHHAPSRIQELLLRVSERTAAVLDVPVGRTVAFATLHAPETWVAGGVSATLDSDPAPYFVAHVSPGVPSADRERLLSEITDAVCVVLGASRVRVRGRIEQVASDGWAVGGITASAQRRAETVVRSPML